MSIPDLKGVYLSIENFDSCLEDFSEEWKDAGGYDEFEVSACDQLRPIMTDAFELSFEGNSQFNPDYYIKATDFLDLFGVQCESEGLDKEKSRELLYDMMREFDLLLINDKASGSPTLFKVAS